MKIKRKQKLLLLFAFLFCTIFGYAQLPAVNVQAGYPVGRSAVQVAYGNSKYLLLTNHQYNQVFQSATGSSWNAVTATGLSTSQLNSMAYGAGIFVVVGDGGVIQTSTDGITWTSRTSGTTNNLTHIYFVNSKFFAIGTGRTLVTSTDGITWTAITFNAGDPADFFMSLTYGNGVYILSARKDNGPQGIIYRSTTAASNSWTSTTTVLGGLTVNRIQYLNNKFFVFTTGNNMFQSSDGTTWTDLTSSIVLTNPDGTTTPWVSGHQAFNGVWDGTKYSFYGYSQYYSDNGGFGSTFTSTDGVHFTLLTKTAYIIPQESCILNGTYFICGSEGIVSSSDGLTYKHNGAVLYDMVKTAGKYVAAGLVGSDGQIYNSTDFINWTSRGPANIRELYTVAYDGSRLLAGGYRGVYSSTNEGDTWTQVYSNVDETFNVMAYGNGRFVAGGWGADGGFLRYSSTGSSWTTASTANNSYTKIKWVNNQFFALGTSNDDNTGRILQSADGISWTDVTPSPGFDVFYFKDVVYDGTKYHFLGIETSGSFFTLSTATPTNAACYGNKAVCSNIPAGVTLGGTWDEGLLEYANGKFTGAVIDIATGQDYIISSTNGSSWTALPQASASTISAAYVNGNTVQMLGRANAFFTVNNGSVLPLSLLNFNGSLYESSVQLRWSTTSEQNTDKFVVQYSTDGATWQPVGTVKAAGNSSSLVAYQFTHSNPMEGANFYRLQQWDRDGQPTYSRVAVVNYGKSLKAAWYPNPVINQLTLTTASAQPGMVTLINAGGQPVRRARISGYETQVDLSGLPAGVYVADIRQGASQQRLSIVKN